MHRNCDSLELTSHRLCGILFTVSNGRPINSIKTQFFQLQRCTRPSTMYYHDTSSLIGWFEYDEDALAQLSEEGAATLAVTTQHIPSVIDKWRSYTNVCKLGYCAAHQSDLTQARPQHSSTSCNQDAVARPYELKPAGPALSATHDDVSVASAPRVSTIGHVQTRVSAADLSPALEVPHPASQSPTRVTSSWLNGHTYPNVLVQGSATAQLGNVNYYETNIYNGTPATRIAATCVVSGAIGSLLGATISSRTTTLTMSRLNIANTISGTPTSKIPVPELSDPSNLPCFCRPEMPPLPKDAANPHDIFSRSQEGYLDGDEKTVVGPDTGDGNCSPFSSFVVDEKGATTPGLPLLNDDTTIAAIRNGTNSLSTSKHSQCVSSPFFIEENPKIRCARRWSHKIVRVLMHLSLLLGGRHEEYCCEVSYSSPSARKRRLARIMPDWIRGVTASSRLFGREDEFRPRSQRP